MRHHAHTHPYCPQMAMEAGYAVVRVLSTEFSEEMLGLLPAACKSLKFAASIQVGGGEFWLLVCSVQLLLLSRFI